MPPSGSLKACLKSGSLRAANNLAGKVTVQGIDRAARQRVILGKEMLEDFVVLIAAVCQHGNCGSYMLGNHTLVVEEGQRYALSFWGIPGNELSVLEQVISCLLYTSDAADE